MRVSSLNIYPVKACGGQSLEQSIVTWRGLESDRRWMIVDRAGRQFTQRENGTLALIQCDTEPDGVRFVNGPTVKASEAASEISVTIWGDRVRAALAPDPASAWISERIGEPVRLVYLPESVRRSVDAKYGRASDNVSFADGYPVLITASSSLEALNARLRESVPMRRFRPNIVIDQSAPFAEDTWRTVRIGNLEFDLVKSCARCVVVDTDPDTGLRSKGVLKELARFRREGGQVHFGQNAIPRDVGVIAVGDAVEILTSGEPRPFRD